MSSLFSSWLSGWTVPNVLLFGLLALGFWVLWKSHKAVGFEVVDMLKDETGKASSARLSLFVALGVSTYMIVYLATNKLVGDETLFHMFAIYIVTWAGTKSIEKLIDAWAGKGGNIRGHRSRDRNEAGDCTDQTENHSPRVYREDPTIQHNASPERSDPEEFHKPKFPDRGSS